MHRVFKAFVKKSFKSVWAPFMFSNLLATFWGTYGLFGDRSMVHIQLMGASKMLLGVSEPGLEISKAHVANTTTRNHLIDDHGTPS